MTDETNPMDSPETGGSAPGRDPTSVGAAPVQDLDPARPASRRRWFKRPRAPVPEGQEPSTGRWGTSAKEEIERFRGVPVVGKLPWRMQYLALAGVLALALVVMASGLATSRSSGWPPALSAAAQTMAEQARLARAGQPVDLEALAQAHRAVQGIRQPRAFVDLDEAVAAWVGKEQQWSPWAARARESAAALGSGQAQAQALWGSIESEGLMGRPEATNLARLLGQFQALQADLDALSSGDPAPAAPARRQAALDGFGQFRESPLVAQSTASLTRAWREASAAWAQASPVLGQLQALEQLRQDRSQALAGVESAHRAWIDALAARARQGGSAPGALVFLAAPVALVALCLLLMVAWRQQQWQVLHARAAAEQIDEAAFDLAQDLAAVGAGDLTRQVRPAPGPLGVLGQAINQAVAELRALLVQARKAAADATAAALHAAESSGVVIDERRAQLAQVEAGSQDLLRLIEGIGTAAARVEASRKLAEEAVSAMDAVRDPVMASLDHARDIRERVDEASSRSHRLVDASNELSSVAGAWKEISEQLEILGMQAALQASRAGESGQGFKIVAREIQALSEESAGHARQATSLVETALSDLEALRATLAGALANVGQGSTNAQQIHEAWSRVSSQLHALSDHVAQLHEGAREQQELASDIDGRVRHDLERSDPQAKAAQEASEAGLKLSTSARALEEAVSRIKA